jgi:hypothetical protein
MDGEQALLQLAQPQSIPLLQHRTTGPIQGREVSLAQQGGKGGIGGRGADSGTPSPRNH